MKLCNNINLYNNYVFYMLYLITVVTKCNIKYAQIIMNAIHKKINNRSVI